jgi:hypothetical protein
MQGQEDDEEGASSVRANRMNQSTLLDAAGYGVMLPPRTAFCSNLDPTRKDANLPSGIEDSFRPNSVYSGVTDK